MAAPDADVKAFSSRGFEFRVDESALHLEPLLRGDLDALARGPGVRRIKSNNVRTVVRVPLPEGAIFLKRYHVRGPKEWIKYLFVPSRAVAEWRAARAMRAAGLPSVHALMMGEKRSAGILRDGTLATAEIPDALDFVPYLHHHFVGHDRAALRRDLLKRLAVLIRRFHDLGFIHGDLHSGNVLVTGAPENNQVHLLDLHSVTRRRAVPRKSRVANLGKLMHSLTSGTTTTDRLRFLLAYEGDRPSPIGAPRETLREIVARVERLERRRVRSRTKRCMRRSGSYDFCRLGEYFIRYRKSIMPIAPLLAIGDHLLSRKRRGPEVLKDSRRSALSRQVIPARPELGRVVVKEAKCRGLLDVLKNAFRTPRGVASWQNACGLEVRKIGVARSLAVVSEGTWPLRRRTWLIMEDLSGMERLDMYVLERYAGPLSSAQRAEKVRLVRDFGHFVGNLHRRGIYHGDLKAVNIFVAPDGTFRLVDYDRVEFGTRVSVRRRIKNLAQVGASVPVCITKSDRLRFFRAYAADPATNGLIRRFARGVLAACRKKIVVHMEPIE